jgi:hypothetical protein
MIEPWLSQLVQGTADEHIVEIAEALSGSAKAVVAGRVAIASQDWQALVNLDPLFAQSKPTDLWFVEATKLMVEWRNNLANSERRSDLAALAWQIIDLAIATHPNPDLYAARISAAYLADRPEEVLETARRLTYLLDAELELIEELVEEQNKPESAKILEFRQRQIEIIKRAVTDVAERHNLNETSVEEVITKLVGLQELAADVTRL